MKLIKKEFISYLKRLIPELTEASGGTEVMCKCKYCSSSSGKLHMYIHVPQSDDDPPLFHCFKCNTSGVLNSKIMMTWGIYDPLVATEVDSICNNASKKGKFSNKGNIIRYNFYNICTDLALGYKKIDYINDRLGTNLTLDECINSKVCLSLKESLRINGLRYTRSDVIVDQLDQNFVGFISHDNNFINLRRIVPEGIVDGHIDSRYVNYNIHDSNGNSEKFYMLPFAGYNPNEPYIVNIHIAEGPFDILSIKNNFHKDNIKDIFIAIAGSGYRQIVDHILYEFKIYMFNLHLYPDNDDVGTDLKMYEVIEYLEPFGTINVYIHRNMYPGQKDFGVKKDLIQDRFFKS